MVWKVELDSSAEKELAKLERQVAIRILKFLHEQLAKSENPRLLTHACGSLLWRFLLHYSHSASLC